MAQDGDKGREPNLYKLRSPLQNGMGRRDPNLPNSDPIPNGSGSGVKTPLAHSCRWTKKPVAGGGKP